MSDESSSVGSSMHDPFIVRALRMRRWLGCLWRTSRYKAPFSLVLVLLVSLSIVIPVVVSDCLLSWSSNSLIQDRARTETDWRDERAVRLASAQLLDSFGTRVCDAYFTSPDGKLWGVVRGPDGHNSTWTTNSSNITCQTVLTDLPLLRESTSVDWCMDLLCETGIWFTVTNHSIEGDERWTSVYQSDVTLYVSFSRNVFQDGVFKGTASSDWIVPSIKLLLADMALKDGVGFLIEPDMGHFLGKDMENICSLKFSRLKTRSSRLSSIAEMRRMQECFIQLKAGTHALSKFVPPQVVLSIMQSRSGQVERYMKTK
eukprot:m51a1_g13100 hypothetical protein (315) ;mRNA; r:1292-2802